MNAANQYEMGKPRSFVDRYLDPTDVLGEVLFGLIMVLAFTLGAGLVVQEGSEATNQMLYAIIGCNVAWGLIDGGMYLVSVLFEQSLKVRLLKAVQAATSSQDAATLIGEVLNPRLGPLTTEPERERLYEAMYVRLQHATVRRPRLQKEDLFGALASFSMVVISAIPAVAPFLIFPDRFTALRVSNLLLLSILFLVGFRVGQVANANPWIVGASALLVGSVMVLIVIALGG